MKIVKIKRTAKAIDGNIYADNLDKLRKIADNIKLVYELGKKHGSVSIDVLEDQMRRFRDVISSLKNDRNLKQMNK